MNKILKHLLFIGMVICMIGYGVASAYASTQERAESAMRSLEGKEVVSSGDKTEFRGNTESVRAKYNSDAVKKLQEQINKGRAELAEINPEKLEKIESQRDLEKDKILMDADGGSIGSGQGIEDVLTPDGWIIVDITSGPAHAIIMALQKVLPGEIKELKNAKMDIRKRMSVRKKKKKDDEASDESGSTSKSGSDWYYYDREDGVMAEKGEKIDAKLSKIKIKSKEVTDMAGEGVVGTEVVEVIRKPNGNFKSAQELFEDQQNKYITAAGTEETQARYEQERLYNEQEQAIQMIAYAATVRQNVADTIEQMVEKVNEHYDASGDKKDCDYGCVKWDLDKENKENTVHKNTDYNQVLREYAYYSLIYDQMLSLEQQIIGLRLQAKGAAAEQKASVLSDVLKSERE